MKKLILLFKILFSSAYGISKLKYKASKNKLEMLKPAALIAIIIISLLPMFLGYIYYMWVSYDSLAAYGQHGAIITMGVVSSSTIVMFFGFFYVVSIFYFTNDTEHLVTLPLKPYMILGAKFLVVLISEYIIELPLVLPPVIIYGVKSGAGLIYWVYCVLAALTVPVIPLCITSMLAIIMMRVTNIGKRRDLFRIIGGVVAIFVMMGVQLYIQRTAMSGDPEKLKSILFSSSGLISLIARNFPPAAWISLALVQYNNVNGLLMLILFIMVSIVFLGGLLFIGEKLYLGGYLGSNESSRGKRSGKEALERTVAVKSKVSAIFWREFKILNRVPIFFLNCVLPVFLVPLIFIMMYFTAGSEILNDLEPLIKGPGGLYTATVILSGIGAFTGAVSMVAPTSISREGAEFFISKYIPVSFKDQVLGKLLHSLALVIAGDVLAVCAIGFMLGFPVFNIAISLLISAMAVLAFIEDGLIIDLFRPLLVWDNPQKAVKQNLNGIISILLNTSLTGIIMFAVLKLISDQFLGYAILTLIFGVLSIALYRALMSYASKRYMEIEP